MFSTKSQRFRTSKISRFKVLFYYCHFFEEDIGMLYRREIFVEENENILCYISIKPADENIVFTPGVYNFSTESKRLKGIDTEADSRTIEFF